MADITTNESAYLCGILNHAEGPKGYLEDVFQDDASSFTALSREVVAGVIISLLAKGLATCSCDFNGNAYIRLTPDGLAVALLTRAHGETADVVTLAPSDKFPAGLLG